MRKHLLFVWATILMVALSFTACEKEEEIVKEVKLATPELTHSLIDPTSFSVSWKAVDNAVSYVYDFDGTSVETNDLSVTFSELEAASTHVVKVKAVAEKGTYFLDSDWAELSVTLDEDPGSGETPATFEITCDIDGKNVHVKVMPGDKQMAHFSQILSEEDYKDYDNDPKKAFQGILDSYKEFLGSGTYDILKDFGDIEFDMDMGAYNLTGYVFAAGIDEDLNITTDVAVCQFKTGPLPVSENTFQFELLEKGPARAVVEITPSNNDPYTMVLMEKDDLIGYTDEDMRSLFSKEYKGWIMEHLYVGKMDMTYTTGLFPDTEYILFVFGWDTEPTTELYKFELKTEPPVVDDNMTFEFFAEVLGPAEILARVTPSSKESLYFTDVLPKSEFDKYGADNLIEYYKYICEINGGYSLADYVRLFAVTGDNEYLYDYMDPNTEYVLIAVPVTLTEDKAFFHKVHVYDQTLVTPAN